MMKTPSKLYHGTSIQHLPVILASNTLVGRSKLPKLSGSPAFVSFTDDPSIIKSSKSSVILVFDGLAIGDKVLKVVYSVNWMKNHPAQAAYICGATVQDEEDIEQNSYDALEYEDEQEWTSRSSELNFPNSAIKEIIVFDIETEDLVKEITNLPVRFVSSTDAIEEAISVVAKTLQSKNTNKGYSSQINRVYNTLVPSLFDSQKKSYQERVWKRSMDQAVNYKMMFVKDSIGEGKSDLLIVDENSITGSLNEIFCKLEKLGILDSSLSSWIHSVASKLKDSDIEFYDFLSLSEDGLAYVVLSLPEVSDADILGKVRGTR